MREAKGHVVLLNSDTLVTPGWLSGLQSCLASDERIGTATPWTNNGEIASFPRFCQPNPIPGQLEALGRLVGNAIVPTYPEIPTAVGFCMAISRQAIDIIGYFDEQQFGRGYGEENDFSMRALNAGFRNVLCDAVYVAHHGGSSFGPIGLRPGEDSMARLLQKHPGYLQRVRDFIESDPLAVHRARLLEACAQAGISLG
jgi:GT2 family glycosyltransferase